MRVPVSWLREYVELPADIDADGLERAFVRVGLEVEAIHDHRSTVEGPLVVGRVRGIEELTGLKKPIRFCLVDTGEAKLRGIVCGATNFAIDDAVVVALPGAVLPGDFAIASRKTYGRVSDGMICSARELGLGDDHTGIIVLDAQTAPEAGTDARPTVGLDEVVVELAITPDRGYCFSIRGLARELSHSLDVTFRDPAKVAKPAKAAPGGYPVRVEDEVGCPRFTALAVRGIDPAAPSPQWLKHRLTMAGMRPISLAVDITNYLMWELGQPMHAFDLGRLKGELVVRRAAKKERLTTLDGVKRTLDPEDMIIADDSGVISLAAVMGGATTEVSQSTVDVLFEAAHWDPVAIARACRRHRLSSEASKRFERGVDPQLPPSAVARAAAMLVEYAGGVIDTGVTDVDAVRPAASVTISADLPSRTAGVDYPVARVTELLQLVGCKVSQQRASLKVTPPSWRPDLTDPADFAEEVVRLDGYHNVPSVLPSAPAGRGLTPTQRRRRSVGRALAEAGFVEVLCYPFVGEAALDALGIGADDPRRDAVRLVNPISEEEPALRTTLLPPLLATLRRNLGRGHRDVALYEIGMVFHPGESSAKPPRLPVTERPSDVDIAKALRSVPRQPWRAAAVLTGEADSSGWWGSGRAADWSDAVQAARLAVAAAGHTAQVRAVQHAPWHPGRAAEILVNDASVGYAGELHPAVCAALDLPKRTSAMEIELDALPVPPVTAAPAVSNFPPALIDVALVVPRETPADDVADALVAGAGELLEAVRLFDVYTGEQLGAGRKSLAYKLTFRAPDRTLTVEEAVAARDSAVAVAADRVGAVLRGG